MKLYSFTSKDVPKYSSIKSVDSYVDTTNFQKQTHSKFKYNSLLLLGGITLFLIGVYFLVVSMFLYISSGLANQYHNDNSINTIATDASGENIQFFSSEYIRNLNSIDYGKDDNSSAIIQVWYLGNSLLSPNLMPEHRQDVCWVHSQVPIHHQTSAVWIHRIQVTFLIPHTAIPSNHLKMNYKTILS